MENKGITLIISIYKHLDFLSIIFNALEKQSDQNFEVILAEDNDAIETITFIESKKNNFSFKITHLSQADTGFRKNAILNKAIGIAQFETIVFIDGDCIPHHEFIKEYIKGVQPHQAHCGRRVMLSRSKSELLKNALEYKESGIISLIINNCKSVEEAIFDRMHLIPVKKSRGLIGCNWGIHKKHLLEVNGFDETYNTPCVGEDVDIEWRLSQMGVKFLSIRHRAIVYHLYHPEQYNDQAYIENMKILQKTKDLNQIKSLNGIKKIGV